MISYVIPENPDDRVLKQAALTLSEGQLICMPLDTNWFVLADPHNKVGVEKLYRLRGAKLSKHFTVFCAGISEAAEIAFIDDAAFRLIKKTIPGPYTFIFKAQKSITRFLKASKTDHEIGIRFAPTALLKRMLQADGRVLIGSHLTASMLKDHPEDLPIWSGIIEEQFQHDLSMIIDVGEVEFSSPTSVVSFVNGFPELLRSGAGDLGVFGL